MRRMFGMALGLMVCTSLLPAESEPVVQQQEMAAPQAAQLRKGRPEGMVRVLVGRQLKDALVEVRGGYRVIDPADGAPLSSGTSGKCFVCYPQPQGLRWGQEYPGVFQVFIEPTSRGGYVMVNGIQYHGAVAIYQVEKRLAVVNYCPLEDYVKSALATQLRESMAPEAMNAMAIAARSDAWASASLRPTAFFDLDSEEVCYAGHGVTQRDNGVDLAVDSTRGLVLVTPTADGYRPVAARWMADNDAAALAALSGQSASATDSPAAAPQKGVSWAMADQMARRGADARRILTSLFGPVEIQLIQN
jgi:stage II sporulation protein D